VALIACPECTREISDKAAACPHCGNPRQAAPPAPQEYYFEPTPQPVVVQPKGEGCFLQTLNLGCFLVFALIGIAVLAMIFRR